MPAIVSYPGVYVVEEPSGARAIAGVPTSIAAFIGMAERGRMTVPIRIFNIADFEREYGPTTNGELADQVRQFYLNGGGQAYVCRIADGALPAAVTLQSEDGDDALVVTARDPGLEGNLIRVEVDYATAGPERTFNMTVYRSRLQPDGSRRREAVETFAGLSMDPVSGSFVETIVNGSSALVTVDVQEANTPAAGGVSIAGLVLPAADADIDGALAAAVTAASRSIRISVANHPPITVALTLIADIAGADDPDNITDAWTNDINVMLTSNGIAATVAVAISADETIANGGVGAGRLLEISSGDGPVVVTPAGSLDATAALMLGAAAGGLEGDNFGDFRPAPTGLVARNGTSVNRFAAFRRFAAAQRGQLTGFALADDSPDSPHGGGVVIALGGAVAMVEAGGIRTLANARAALDVIAAAIDANSHDRWTARRQGNRLALVPRYGTESTGPAAVLTTSGGVNIGAANFPFAAGATPANVAAYTVGQPGGVAGGGDFQTASVQGDDGNIPLPADYAAAFAAIERDVDLFNIMVLPRAAGQSDAARQALWGPASAFCARERAFLLVDPRSDWSTITLAEQGVDQIRTGVETRNAAAYWPRLRIADGTPAGRIADPSGSIAGLMARIDGNRGVWKAPAGLEATIRGVAGVERRMTDPENGVINPKALNAVRVFPSGVVAWGARTLVGFDGSGNIDDKYVPVRRTMLFIEESLYRGLHFAVFEPNDEPLWAQIRLAAGSFMNGLFRQGAFAGAKASDAYFVLCDATTTTPNDINLGIVNVIVGFAPLKPAEFVVITVKQIAGQAQI
jgi:phage tail sheath protein FI